MEITLLKDHVEPRPFLTRALKATTSTEIEKLLGELKITPDSDYSFDEERPETGWQEGRFHWMPVGRDRGNAGRIKLANTPVNPIAERTVNGMEALIEMLRQRELAKDAKAAEPKSPREAVRRYFKLPPLHELPGLDKGPEGKNLRKIWRDLSNQLRVRLMFDSAAREFAVAIEDDGIGQSPEKIHRTLLSLGSTTKADKPYLIGLFGQGGSSAYAVSKYSWVVSRRAKDLLKGEADGMGWTVVRQVFQRGRRDPFFAYLASHPDGRVPMASASDADFLRLSSGTRFVHVGYDFGKGGSAITRQLYQSLNHVLYNPILPFTLYVGTTEAVVSGNAYRLSRLSAGKHKPRLDKVFPDQPVATAGVR